MKLTTGAIKPSHAKVDVLAIFAFKDTPPKQVVEFMPVKLRAEILKLSLQTKFKAKAKQVLTFTTHGQLPAFLIVLIGLGSQKRSADKIAESLREASALLTQTAQKYQAQKIGIVLPANLTDLTVAGQACAEGLILSDYKFKKYKKTPKKPEPKIQEAVFLHTDNKFKQGLKLGQIVSNGVSLARDLINEPAGEMTPDNLLKTAKQIAQKSDLINLKSFNKSELKKQGFGGIAAVSQGSWEDAHLIHLTYKPEKQKNKLRIALIGKGLTFDSGGLSIKPSDYMENMKTDMAGAAAVLGIFSILTQIKPAFEVHGIIAACENMPGPKAIKPGDIVKIKNNKTVEILNTDAEGRLVLADALSYAIEQKIERIIDIATLTGACIAALGDNIAGIMGNNQKLVDDIITAGQTSGEKIWQLPLEPDYQKSLKSEIADLRNICKMKGGHAITAALFLKQFVNKTPWAHLDIAGPAWAEKPMNGYTPAGAVGFGVRTVVEYLKIINYKL